MSPELGVSSGDPVELLDKAAWHRSIESQAMQSRQTGSPLSVLFVDVSRFKEINDTYGHTVGDEVLEEIGEVVSSITQSFFVGGRIGGDEFAISGEVDAVGAAEITKALRQAFADFLERPSSKRLKELGIDLAIGQATLEENMTSSDLLRKADENMYRDKFERLPELTITQFATLAAARRVLQDQGLRLRDIDKYSQLLD